MNKVSCISALFITLALGSAHAAEDRNTNENPLFAYTHMLPSPYNIPGGKLVIGTTSAVGLTDFLQVSSDIIRDFYQVFNATAKLQLLDFDGFALALTMGWEHYNLNNIVPTNPDLAVTSWQPGGVTAFSLDPQLALFVGGHLNLTNVDFNSNGVESSGYVQGFFMESDLSWAYNPKKKSIGNALSAGVTYDFTYKIYGIGISHHWPGLHLGIHYYPNADQYKVQPILAGGAVVDL
jgi:hypothetical protein